MNNIDYNLNLLIEKLYQSFSIPKNKLNILKKNILKNFDDKILDIKFKKISANIYIDANNNKFILLNSELALKIL
jgi:hypothetical protein